MRDGDRVPAATAAAEPPLDPPVLRVSSHGLWVAPYASGSVVMLVASSGVFVLPTNTNPAARKRAASHVSSGSIQPASFSTCMPAWYGSPAVWHTASFTRNGTPANGPPGGRRASAAGRVRSAVDHRVELAVDALDALDRGVDELARGDVAAVATSSAWAVASSRARSSVTTRAA